MMALYFSDINKAILSVIYYTGSFIFMKKERTYDKESTGGEGIMIYCDPSPSLWFNLSLFLTVNKCS